MADGDQVGLLTLLREDWETNERSVSRAGFQALAVHRLQNWAQVQPRPVGLPLRLVLRVLYVLVRNVYGIEVPKNVVVGRRVKLAHQGGIVLNEHVTVGDDCLIRHNVTIGGRSEERWTEAPAIGNGVQIGPGAVITGRLKVGDGARIGPNALVIDDVPPDARVLSPVAVVRVPSPRDGEAARADDGSTAAR